MYYIRHVQRGLIKSNHSFTSAVIRIHAPMEAPALCYAKTLKTSSTAHALWNITADCIKNEEQLQKNRGSRSRVVVKGAVAVQTNQKAGYRSRGTNGPISVQNEIM